MRVLLLSSTNLFKSINEFLIPSNLKIIMYLLLSADMKL